MNRILLLLAAGTLLFVPVSLAQMTGQDLLRVCKNVQKKKITLQEIRDINYCLGYVTSFVESHYQIFLIDDDRGFCLDENLSFKAVSASVVNYLENHPDKLKQKAYFALDESMKAIYPCQ